MKPPYRHFAWLVRQTSCRRVWLWPNAETCLELPGAPELCPSCLAKRWFPSGVKPEKGWKR